MTPISPAALIAEARKLLGVPWKHQGRGPSGVDCIGFVDLAARNAGLSLAEWTGEADRRDYGMEAKQELYDRVARHCQRIETPVPGCLLFFKFPKDARPRHFGIYTELQTVIHAHSVNRRVIEHGYRAPWPRWTHSIWLLPGVSYDSP